MKRTQNQPAAEVEVTPADALRDAALYLQRHGWTQGELYREGNALTPPACAAGAIRCALLGAPLTAMTSHQRYDVDRALAVLAGHVHDTTDDNPDIPADPPSGIVGDWNDAATRTAQQVIDTLRAAADDWDRIHGGAR
jgi:hypothetical protein